MNDNTDTWVTRQLAPELLPLMRRYGRAPFEVFTDLMDDMMAQLHAAGVSSAQIRGSMHSIPMQPGMHEAVCAIHDHGGDRGGSRRISQCILSDANRIFIGEALAGKQLAHAFADDAAVITNGASVDAATDRVHVRRFHAPSGEEPPHGCAHCPANLCKGRVLESLRAQHLSRIAQSANGGRVRLRVAYVGDGGGDWCPTVRLRSGDVVLARHDFTLGNMWRDHLAKLAAEPLSSPSGTCAAARSDSNASVPCLISALPDGREFASSHWRGSGECNVSVADALKSTSCESPHDRPHVVFWSTGLHVRDTMFDILSTIQAP